MNYQSKIKSGLIIFLLFISISINAQSTLNPDTVKAGKYDTGKMWAFEFPPFEYLKQVYNFTPDQTWFDDVRLSALRIPGCTASFVSEDGLVMTNNHCARGLRRLIEKEGEDLANTGFIAENLDDERKIPNYFAEQLQFIKDVTKDVQDAISKGNTEAEKISLRDAKMKDLKEQYEKETGLKCDVISYYNGSIFFVQGFKVYTDVRLVFEPEETIAYFGGDYDNFTFPRYNLDCTFMRVYDENGKPLKTKNYFKFSSNGAAPGELVFTVGNPGTTNRLRTVAQLEYLRDVTYRNYTYLANNLYNIIEVLKGQNPSKADMYETTRLGFSNGQKSLGGTYTALCNPYLMARKKDFEEKLVNFVNSDPELKKQYGSVWKSIEATRNEMRKVEPTISAFSINPAFASRYLSIANALVIQAKQKLLPENQREPMYSSARYLESLKNIYPADFDNLLESAKLELNLDYIKMNLGENNPILNGFFNGNSKDAAANLIAKSLFKDKQSVDALFQKTPEEILALNDPFIQYYAKNYDKVAELKKQQKEINDTENITFGLLGQIIYKMYGTSVTPDANRTLRISDGLVKGYNYNGTIAQPKTSFYGLYDRFVNFGGKYPFNLGERWKTPDEDLDLNTAFNFVATNDIVGGNSGSAIINKNAEVIGLAFDGNIESLEGNFIYLPDVNRTVGVDSKGMWEAIDKVYEFDRLADELKEGKIN